MGILRITIRNTISQTESDATTGESTRTLDGKLHRVSDSGASAIAKT
jgi:hypothetical protein